MALFQATVTSQWLEDQMKSEEWKANYRLFDCTWDLPSSKRNFKEEHSSCRIPGAKLFELSECRNKEASLPNTVPSQSHFENYVKQFGLGNDHHVILYDNSEKFGLFSAPRVWWLLNLFGHSKVSILDGGLPKWKKEGRKTISGEYTENENVSSGSTFKTYFNPDLVKDLAFMKSNLEQGCPVQVLDARPNGRFRGVAPEPRPDIPSGHMPKSFNVPFFTTFNRQENILLSPEEIQKCLKDSSVDFEKPMVTSCGSGISACVLILSIFVATGKMVPLFDDSWFGWQTNTSNDLQIREL